jgi:hypothetical protein
MVEVIRQRPMNILHPYTAEVYVAKDGSEACLSHLVEGVLRAERLGEGGQAGTGV